MAIALPELLPAQVWPSAETAVESVTNHMPPGLELAEGSEPTTVEPSVVWPAVLIPFVTFNPVVGESDIVTVPAFTCVPELPVLPVYQLHVPGVPLPVERPQLEPNGDQPV